MPLPWKTATKRPGRFIKSHLERHGEASVAQMHRAYTGRIRGENYERRQLGRRDLLRKPTYHSFYNYFRVLRMLGLVELVGEMAVDPEEMSAWQRLGFAERLDGDWVVQEGARQRLYQLTQKGRTEEEAWDNPWQALYPR